MRRWNCTARKTDEQSDENTANAHYKETKRNTNLGKGTGRNRDNGETVGDQRGGIVDEDFHLQRMVTMRRGTLRRSAIAVAAIASGGEMMAPRTKPAASGR